METIFHIDWKSLFWPTTSLAEIAVRGTLIYLFLFLLLRVLRREAGAMSISDVLVIVLIADAAQNAMAAEYRSITEGVVLVSTIVGWDYLLDWLGYRFITLRRLLRPLPVLLIKDGKLLRRNLRQELISREELLGLLREEGVSAVKEVQQCYLEADGHLSVITKEQKKTAGKDKWERMQ